MRTNPVKQKLAAGEQVVGTMVFEFSTTGVGRISAAAGAEFVLYDMEHTGWSVETIRSLIATTPQSVVPLVRVPAADYHFIARVLDAGAMGIMVPMVTGSGHAEAIVSATKYPPTGRRGGAFGIAHDDYIPGDVAATMRSANENVLVIAQIETVAGLENVEAIAAVRGIDILWIGQSDLTNSLGIPGRFDDPQFETAVDRVVAAAQSQGRAAGYMAMTVEEARRFIDRGFRCLAFSGDLWLYQTALREGITGIRGG